MNRLYEKNKLTHALAWVIMYVVLLSAADGLSVSLGVQKCITVPLCFIMVIALLRWIFRNGHAERFGLCAVRGRARDYLYYAPLAVICLVNLFGGAAMRMTALETALYMASMLGVGLLEEVIFRGLLFRAMQDSGTKHAMLISGVTFGLGHIVNLLNGAPFIPTLAQVVYATALGMLFVVIFVKGGSLAPCIIVHCIVNMLSAFAPERGGWLGPAVLTLIPAAYAWWLWKNMKKASSV